MPSFCPQPKLQRMCPAQTKTLCSRTGTRARLVKSVMNNWKTSSEYIRYIVLDFSFFYYKFVQCKRLIWMTEQFPKLLMIMETYQKKTLSRLLKKTSFLILGT